MKYILNDELTNDEVRGLQEHIEKEKTVVHFSPKN